jgi:hypothetical protein
MQYESYSKDVQDVYRVYRDAGCNMKVIARMYYTGCTEMQDAV